MHQFREIERMEHKQSEVLVFGTWASSFSRRVQIALKLKGIDYEYAEEDLINKSQRLLSYNPVLKQVPVLVHKGRPIAESRVILEYIDENWSSTPKLLPEDPFERAKVRFWAKFYDDKIVPSIYAVIMSKGKDRENATLDLSELFKVFEQGMKKDFQEKPPFFNGDSLGFLGIVVSSYTCGYKAFHEAVGITILTPEKNPALLSWVNELRDHPLINETLPPHDKLVARLKFLQP